MSRIKLLDQHLADKIAAGEVIERPLSVVKELLENSVDAQATIIEITIKDGGVGLIKVRDDGLGMDEGDLAMAFSRHATSKIEDFNDLFHLQTFGFRGEALASIAAVSQVEMISCTKDSSEAHKIKLAGGLPPEMEALGGSNGTTIEVKNLFYNIPARRKFLKSASYEAGLIGELVSKYALGHPGIRFKLTNNGQTTIDTAGLHTVAKRLVYFYGESIAEAIITIPSTELLPNHFVQGWLIKEEVSRSNRNQETFFVNGRLIKSGDLAGILEAGYYTLLPKGRFPLAVVDLTLPGEQLDVNIHPAKLEIKINDLDRLRPLLTQVFKDALWEANISKNAFLVGSFEQTPAKNYQENKSYALKSGNKATAPPAQVTTQTLPKPANSPSPPELLQSATQQAMNFAQVAMLTDTVQETTLPFVIEQSTGGAKALAESQSSTSLKNKEISGEDWQARGKIGQLKDISDLVLMGQVNNSFIIAQNKEGLFIIDQHTCHERILYERFMQQEQDRESISEDLLIPVSINLSPEQDAILINHIFTFKELGFMVENFGERSYLIRGLPLGLGNIDDPEGLFMDLIDDLGQSKVINGQVIKEKFLITASCKGAVKARWPLNQVEMLTLLHDLGQVKNAHTCPHGRPIVYKLSMEELYSIFKRGAYTYHD